VVSADDLIPFEVIDAWSVFTHVSAGLLVFPQRGACDLQETSLKFRIDITKVPGKPKYICRYGSDLEVFFYCSHFRIYVR
jgi:hypothetical protein